MGSEAGGVTSLPRLPKRGLYDSRNLMFKFQTDKVPIENTIQLLAQPYLCLLTAEAIEVRLSLGFL